jgi:hypothetical protein
MKKKAGLILVALVLVLGICGGAASLRDRLPDLPSWHLSLPGRGDGSDTADASVTATAIGSMAGAAQEPGSTTESVTIYGAVCPADYAGDDYFGDCYDRPAAGAGYTLAVGETRVPATGVAVAGDDGLVAPTDSGATTPGTVILQAIAPDAVVGSGGFKVPAAACTASDGRAVALTPRESGGVGQLFTFDLRAGDDLRCDVYFVPLTAEA